METCEFTPAERQILEKLKKETIDDPMAQLVLSYRKRCKAAGFTDMQMTSTLVAVLLFQITRTTALFKGVPLQVIQNESAVFHDVSLAIHHQLEELLNAAIHKLFAAYGLNGDPFDDTP